MCDSKDFSARRELDSPQPPNKQIRMKSLRTESGPLDPQLCAEVSGYRRKNDEEALPDVIRNTSRPHLRVSHVEVRSKTVLC